MPSFQHTLIGLGPICDTNCKVIFTKNNVIIYDQGGSPILTGWREKNGARLWRISLTPMPEELPVRPNSADQTNLKAYSAYDLPSVDALVRYFLAAAGFPVRTTWLKAITVGNYHTWPGLNLANATSYCPSADETIKGHIVHSRQSICSNKPKIPRRPIPDTPQRKHPYPLQGQENCTCTQCISVNSKLMIQTDSQLRQEVGTNISW